MRTTQSLANIFTNAKRPQGMDPATVTGIAVAVMALAAAFKSVKLMLDDNTKEALKYYVNGGDVLEDIDRDDPRLRAFLEAIGAVNRALNREASPVAIMRAVDEISQLAGGTAPCQVVLSELHALQFSARERCATLYAKQRHSLENVLSTYVALTEANVARLENSLPDAEPQRTIAQRRIAKTQAAMHKYREDCAKVVASLEGSIDGNRQAAFAKANTLRRFLETERDRERQAYEQLAVTKTTLPERPKGSQSVTFTRIGKKGAGL